MGLMQLVPSSGGRDVYRKPKDEDKMPTRDYLFDLENNIELGAAYLNVLSYAQLDDITIPSPGNTALFLPITPVAAMCSRPFPKTSAPLYSN